LTNYVQQLQPELPVNYCSLIYVTVDDELRTKEAREALAANWPFLRDTDKEILYDLGMVDTTDKEHGDIYIPYTFILDRDRTIYKIYNGWWYVGRPTAEDIRQDWRALMSQRDDWAYSGD
jgi:peroxiredoxin